MTDHPFDDVVQKANELVAEGATVYQKWSCSHCGLRQYMSDPNAFYVLGRCEKCQEVTNIRKQGCNYLLVMGGSI